MKIIQWPISRCAYCLVTLDTFVSSHGPDADKGPEVTVTMRHSENAQCRDFGNELIQSAKVIDSEPRKMKKKAAKK